MSLHPIDTKRTREEFLFNEAKEQLEYYRTNGKPVDTAGRLSLMHNENAEERYRWARDEYANSMESALEQVVRSMSWEGRIKFAVDIVETMQKLPDDPHGIYSPANRDRLTKAVERAVQFKMFWGGDQ